MGGAAFLASRHNRKQGAKGGNAPRFTPPTGAPASRRIQNIFSGFESILGGSNSRAQQLLGDTNRSTLQLAGEFAPRFQRLQQRLIRNDPIASRRQKNAKKALNQQTSLLSQLQQVVSNPDQLDPATKRLVQDNIRSRFASTGMLDSGGSALGEVTGEAKAGLNATSQRISQILSALSGNQSVASGGMSTTPQVNGSFNTLQLANPSGGVNAAIPGIVSGINQQLLQGQQQQFAGQQGIGQGLGQLAGMGIGAFFGGPAGAQIGGQVGGQAGGQFSTA